MDVPDIEMTFDPTTHRRDPDEGSSSATHTPPHEEPESAPTEFSPLMLPGHEDFIDQYERIAEDAQQHMRDKKPLRSLRELVDAPSRHKTLIPQKSTASVYLLESRHADAFEEWFAAAKQFFTCTRIYVAPVIENNKIRRFRHIEGKHEATHPVLRYLMDKFVRSPSSAGLVAFDNNSSQLLPLTNNSPHIYTLYTMHGAVSADAERVHYFIPQWQMFWRALVDTLTAMHRKVKVDRWIADLLAMEDEERIQAHVAALVNSMPWNKRTIYHMANIVHNWNTLRATHMKFSAPDPHKHRMLRDITIWSLWQACLLALDLLRFVRVEEKPLLMRHRKKNDRVRRFYEKWSSMAPSVQELRQNLSLFSRTPNNTLWHRNAQALQNTVFNERSHDAPPLSPQETSRLHKLVMVTPYRELLTRRSMHQVVNYDLRGVHNDPTAAENEAVDVQLARIDQWTRNALSTDVRVGFPMHFVTHPGVYEADGVALHMNKFVSAAMRIPRFFVQKTVNDTYLDAGLHLPLTNVAHLMLNTIETIGRSQEKFAPMLVESRENVSEFVETLLYRFVDTHTAYGSSPDAISFLKLKGRTYPPVAWQILKAVVTGTEVFVSDQLKMWTSFNRRIGARILKSTPKTLRFFRDQFLLVCVAHSPLFKAREGSLLVLRVLHSLVNFLESVILAQKNTRVPKQRFRASVMHQLISDLCYFAFKTHLLRDGAADERNKHRTELSLAFSALSKLSAHPPVPVNNTPMLTAMTMWMLTPVRAVDGDDVYHALLNDMR